MWLWEIKKKTCCKNTVNSTAECWGEEKLATSWILQLHRVIQTAALTFSDLCVESSTVGISGGGREETTAVERAQPRSVLKKLNRRLHTVTLGRPARLLSGWKAARWASMREVCFITKGADNTPPPALIICRLTVCSLVSRQPYTKRSWESRRTPERGKRSSGFSRVMSNMAVYCCPRWSMLLATFFVFFFLHVLYIK